MRLSKATIILSLRSLLFIFTFLTISIVSRYPLSSLTKWWSIICSLCNVITIILLIFLARSLHTSYGNLINYKKGRAKVKSIIFGIILIMTIGLVGMFLAGYIIYRKIPYLASMLIQPIPVGLAVVNLFILPITTTFAEDGLYLGFGVNQIKNKWVAIFVPALFYALQHSFMPLLWNLNYMIYRFLSFLPLTLLLGFWYEKKRNPVPIMIGHFMINFATVIQIVLMSVYPDLYQQMII